ncbi:MAG TPA: methylmalonyl-CoA mutase family protein [Balneolaceae bacterium]
MSDSKTTQKNLFTEFPPVSTEEWEKVIAKDLKGAGYKTKLRWQTGEGISPLPFYRHEDTDQRPPLKQYTSDNSWQIRETIFEQDIEAANKASLRALNNGTQSLEFRLKVFPTEGMLGGDLEGTSIQSQEDVGRLLQNISLEKTSIHFDAGMASPALFAMLWNEVQAQNLNPEKVQSTFSYDPFSFILQKGQLPKDVKAFQKDIIQMTGFTVQNLPGVRPFCVDARTFHNSGATIVQELGFVLASASEYLDLLTDEGFDAAEAANQIHFKFSIGSNYFLEIAKFRAIRLLWQNLVKAFGGDEEKVQPYIHGETSRWNKTLYDPYTNMLRTTTEGMSAAIAGCDSITVLPFDETFRHPDDFSERIARNSQVILSEEAYFDKVADPAAGSYYIEQLTSDMAREAWQFFQEVEKAGGMLKATRDRFVQAAIEESQQKRDQAIARRGRVFVGTNKYPNPEDEMAEKFQPGQAIISLKESELKSNIKIESFIPGLAKALADGAKLGDLLSYLFDTGKENIRPLEFYRGTQAFDELRMATEKHETTPKVLCLPMGNPRMRKARSAFAGNFFGSVGYEIENPIGFESVEEAAKTAGNQSPDVVVICGSDEEYEELVPAVCDELNKLKNRPLVVLAGNPRENEAAFRKAGIDEFIHAKSNALETLKYFQTKLGIIKNDE